MNESPEQALFRRLKEKLPELEKLLEHVNGHWQYEDAVYRYYHQSYKVYYVQSLTEKIVAALRELGEISNTQFNKIIEQGTGNAFSYEHNKVWDLMTRPMLEAFFHAKFFLEMAVKYGRELKQLPQSMLDSGWAAFLYLYDLR